MTRLPIHQVGSVIAFRNFNEEMKHPGVWESNEGATSTTDSSRDNLASLYRPPFKLLFQGSFEKVWCFDVIFLASLRVLCMFMISILVLVVVIGLCGVNPHFWGYSFDIVKPDCDGSGCKSETIN